MVKITSNENIFALKIFNSSTNKLERFEPIDQNNIKIYVCGPTVYDRAHIGNFRSAVIYDIVFRVLLYIYNKVTYVRNITDIDDKIIKAADDQKISIFELTKKMENFYNDDSNFLHCLVPTITPKATENISEIIEMIQSLISNGNAYEADGHVLFDVKTFQDYGKLSGRTLDEMIAGARVDVAPYKKNPEDFVLWKPTIGNNLEYAFESPWGKGRPGWHIECSAMSARYLGQKFDIHGGGVDLIFPHHENEIAQTCATYNIHNHVKYWMHNGFLTVNGQKMSKSLGNFITLETLREKNISGNAMRYFYLMSHYHKPADFNEKALYDANKAIQKINTTLQKHNIDYNVLKDHELKELNKDLVEILCDNLNTPQAIAYLHTLNEAASQNTIGNDESQINAKKLYASYKFLGFTLEDNQSVHNNTGQNIKTADKIPEAIIKLAEERMEAKKNKNWDEADRLRKKIIENGYNIVDSNDGYIVKPS